MIQSRLKNKLSSLDLIKVRLINEEEKFSTEHKISSSKIRERIRRNSIFLEECYLKWIGLHQKKNDKIIYWFNLIRDNYSQEYRHYYNLDYIYRCLKLSEELKEYIDNFKTFCLAFWFKYFISVPSNGKKYLVYIN